MTGHVGRRGWIVLDSVESGDGLYCVDLFEDPGGGFGFEHFRLEPEDGAWAPLGYAATRFDGPEEAIAAAERTVPWLRETGRSLQVE